MGCWIFDEVSDQSAMYGEMRTNNAGSRRSVAHLEKNETGGYGDLMRRRLIALLVGHRGCRRSRSRLSRSRARSRAGLAPAALPAYRPRVSRPTSAARASFRPHPRVSLLAAPVATNSSSLSSLSAQPDRIVAASLSRSGPVPSRPLTAVPPRRAPTRTNRR